MKEFENYYKHLVEWWSAMNTAFGIPDMEEVPEETRKMFLYYRIESEKYTEKMNKVLIKFWDESSPELKDLTFCIAPIEVSKIIAQDNILSKIEGRKDGCFMLNGEIYPMKELNQKLKENNLSLEKVVIENQEEIKGSIAYTGRVIGKVRKIVSFKDMGSFQVGEILVTEMTNPDYLPIMKIAVAVVTDEGGSTCHAAIASRELKIPCIVGTKVATQALNDGDEVEVDADIGIVRILSRGSSFENSIERSLSTYTMVSMGKRLAGLHEASLKVLARSKIWETEIGVGYKTAVMNSLGEYYVDSESREKVYEAFIGKDFTYAQSYIRKLYTLRDEVSKEIQENSEGDFTEKFSYMMAYFFIIKSIFEIIYKKSSPEEQKIIEKWRNDDTLFEPLELYYKTHPEDDKSNKKEWSWVFIDGNLKFYDKNISFSSEEKKKVELKREEFETNQIIKGSTAFPGIVRGKVRLIVSPSDKDLMQEGEIIVAPMTTVDFGPIMKKAVAFVTDEGGIISHAAIVAREMKKPCIIGTKIATQVLQTGMEVEVDADNGVVKIIK